MATTPTYALPYPLPSAPVSAGAADIRALAERLEAVLGAGITPGPPASPTDGMIWDHSPAAGTVWRFRYNPGSASAYKWEFVGGPPLHVADGATAAITALNAWTDAATPSPAFTPTRAGEYLAWGNAVITHGLAGGRGYIGLAVGATSPAINNSSNIDVATRTEALAVQGSLLAATLGDQIRMRYFNEAASGTATFSQRQLMVMPRRIA